VLTTPRITLRTSIAAHVSAPSGVALQRPAAPNHFERKGFHTPKGTNGETIQAAAFCYAYKKIEKLDGIDAFILHRHVDNKGEGGLLLGLRSNQPRDGDARPKKNIYECFRTADSADWEKTFEFALPLAGLKDWNELRP